MPYLYFLGFDLICFIIVRDSVVDGWICWFLVLVNWREKKSLPQSARNHKPLTRTRTQTQLVFTRYFFLSRVYFSIQYSKLPVWVLIVFTWMILCQHTDFCCCCFLCALFFLYLFKFSFLPFSSLLSFFLVCLFFSLFCVPLSKETILRTKPLESVPQRIGSIVSILTQSFKNCWVFYALHLFFTLKIIQNLISIFTSKNHSDRKWERNNRELDSADEWSFL